MSFIFDEVGGIADGEVYCESCWEPVGEDEDGGPVTLGDMQGGETCGSCGACWVDSDWESHESATTNPPDGPRWYTCEGCGHQHPTRERSPGSCPNCGGQYARVGLRIVIDLVTGGAAFDDPAQLGRLLASIAEDVRDSRPEELAGEGAALLDDNGNNCGTVRYEEEA